MPKSQTKKKVKSATQDSACSRKVTTESTATDFTNDEAPTRKEEDGICDVACSNTLLIESSSKISASEPDGLDKAAEEQIENARDIRFDDDALLETLNENLRAAKVSEEVEIDDPDGSKLSVVVCEAKQPEDESQGSATVEESGALRSLVPSDSESKLTTTGAIPVVAVQREPKRVEKKEAAGSRPLAVPSTRNAERVPVSVAQQSGSASPSPGIDSLVASMMRALDFDCRTPGVGQSDSGAPKFQFAQMKRNQEEVTETRHFSKSESMQSMAKYNADLLDFLEDGVLDASPGAAPLAFSSAPKKSASSQGLHSNVVSSMGTSRYGAIGSKSGLTAGFPPSAFGHESIQQRSLFCDGAKHAVVARDGSLGGSSRSAVRSPMSNSRISALQRGVRVRAVPTSLRATYSTPATMSRSRAAFTNQHVASAAFGVPLYASGGFLLAGNHVAPQRLSVGHGTSFTRGDAAGTEARGSAMLPACASHAPAHYAKRSPLDLGIFSIPPPTVSSKVINMSHQQLRLPSSHIFIPPAWHTSQFSGIHVCNAVAPRVKNAAMVGVGSSLQHPHTEGLYVDQFGIPRYYGAVGGDAVMTGCPSLGHPTGTVGTTLLAAPSRALPKGASGDAERCASEKLSKPDVAECRKDSCSTTDHDVAGEAAAAVGDPEQEDDCNVETSERASFGESEIASKHTSDSSPRGKGASPPSLPARGKGSSPSSLSLAVFNDSSQESKKNVKKAGTRVPRGKRGKVELEGGKKVNAVSKKESSSSTLTAKLQEKDGDSTSVGGGASGAMFRCFACGGVGHMIAVCPTAKYRVASRELCALCGSKGHSSRFCQQRAKDAKKPMKSVEGVKRSAVQSTSRKH